MVEKLDRDKFPTEVKLSLVQFLQRRLHLEVGSSCIYPGKVNLRLVEPDKHNSKVLNGRYKYPLLMKRIKLLNIWLYMQCFKTFILIRE